MSVLPEECGTNGRMFQKNSPAIGSTIRLFRGGGWSSLREEVAAPVAGTLRHFSKFVCSLSSCGLF